MLIALRIFQIIVCGSYVVLCYIHLWLYVNLCIAMCVSRVLGPRPPRASLLLLYPGAAVSHRGGGDGHNAPRLLPQHAGRLACGDPGDVWWAQDQREGRADTHKTHNPYMDTDMAPYKQYECWQVVGCIICFISSSLSSVLHSVGSWKPDLQNM